MIKRILSIVAAAVLVLWFAACSGDNYHYEVMPPESEVPDDSGDSDDPDKPVHHDPVTPSGEGWTKADIEDGIIYWKFEGKNPVSKVPQIVHVADIDLSKNYKMKFAYEGDQSITSAIFKKYDAIVAMNGAFGASQIFIKVDGKAYRKIQSDKDDKTGILNWRNDGAICADTQKKAFICNSIFSKDGDGQSEYGACLDEQRKFYRETMASVPNILSGSPLLIYEYNPLGETFVPISNFMSLDYEHPYRHQGQRHPRTAIALTENNHLLMIVADGRQEQYCNGFSSKELTQFLVNNFNPKYALNLDGGGSSTLCIQGHGDPETNVVNYPTDNNIFDHKGERTVQSFIYIVSEN